MFLGHFAVALGAKKAAPEASLGTLVLALAVFLATRLGAGADRSGNHSRDPARFRFIPLLAQPMRGTPLGAGNRHCQFRLAPQYPRRYGAGRLRSLPLGARLRGAQAGYAALSRRHALWTRPLEFLPGDFGG